jgi:acetyltransferase-like isoleucine patch superfamily enzyme
MSPGVPRIFMRAWNLIRTQRNEQVVDAIRSSLASCGRETLIHPTVVIVAPENVHIGEHVLVGPGGWISAVNTSISIGGHVMMAPYVALVAGNHNTSVVGRFMDEVDEKHPEDDQPIVIDDDVWLGMRAIVLKGVTIGRGSVVSAGSVVTHDVVPYSVVAGVPARLVRVRFDREQIERHERELYGRVVTTQGTHSHPARDAP